MKYNALPLPLTLKAALALHCTALTRLDDIEEGSAHGGLLALELLEDILGEVLLQQGLAVGGRLELGEASLQLISSCLVNHFA